MSQSWEKYCVKKYVRTYRHNGKTQIHSTLTKCGSNKTRNTGTQNTGRAMENWQNNQNIMEQWNTGRMLGQHQEILLIRNDGILSR